MAALFPLRWPDSINSIFQAFEFASASSTEVFGLECELVGWSFVPSPVYSEALLVAFLPVVAVFFSYVFWYGLRATRARFSSAEKQVTAKQVKSYIVVSIIVALFLLYTVRVCHSCTCHTCTLVIPTTANLTCVNFLTPLAIAGAQVLTKTALGLFACSTPIYTSDDDKAAVTNGHSFLESDSRIECLPDDSKTGTPNLHVLTFGHLNSTC